MAVVRAGRKAPQIHAAALDVVGGERVVQRRADLGGVAGGAPAALRRVADRREHDETLAVRPARPVAADLLGGGRHRRRRDRAAQGEYQRPGSRRRVAGRKMQVVAARAEARHRDRARDVTRIRAAAAVRGIARDCRSRFEAVAEDRLRGRAHRRRQANGAGGTRRGQQAGEEEDGGQAAGEARHHAMVRRHALAQG